MNKTKIMISFPMKGLSREGVRKLYELYKEKYEAAGFEVVDTIVPEEIPNVPHPDLWCLGRSIQKMAECEGVVFKDRGFAQWKDARGCLIEHEAAKSYGMFIKYEED